MDLTDDLEFKDLLALPNVAIIHGRYKADQKRCSSTPHFRTKRLSIPSFPQLPLLSMLSGIILPSLEQAWSLRMTQLWSILIAFLNETQVTCSLSLVHIFMLSLFLLPPFDFLFQCFVYMQIVCFRATMVSSEAHLHQAYKPCFTIRAISSQTYIISQDSGSPWIFVCLVSNSKPMVICGVVPLSCH